MCVRVCVGGESINGIDLQPSLSCIRGTGRNHTIYVRLAALASFRSIGIDPSQVLAVLDVPPVAGAFCRVSHFHHKAF